MDSYSVIRKKSWEAVKKEGLLTNNNLPFLDKVDEVKSPNDIVNRILCLNAILFKAFDVKGNNYNTDWLKSSNLFESLTQLELDYLQKDIKAEQFETHVESVYALLWAVSLYDEMSFISTPDDIVKKISINVGDSISEFKEKCKLRTKKEIIEVADLYYCVDWANTEHILSYKKEYYYAYIIKRRRQALEWLIYNFDWDEIPLDT